jgi:MOSC domain-containing protein YiiM
MTRVSALYRGGLRSLEPEGQRTGIFKDSIENARVTVEGIVGDHQADRRFHGGPEKALHQYALSSYEKIVSEFPELQGAAIPGSMGENISSTCLNDATVCIGDLYRIGPVLVQVSQPRSPCWKINHKFGVEKLSIFIEQQRITGWYFRVLETGTLHVGDGIELVGRRNDGVSIEHFLHVTKQHRPNLAELDALIGCDGLNQEWVARLKSRREYLDSIK